MARRKSMSEKDVRTVLSVFEALTERPYEEQNKYSGSLTIDEMNDLYWKLRKWYWQDTDKVENWEV